MKAFLFSSPELIDEARSLTESAGMEVTKTYRLPKRPNSRYYVDPNKLEEARNNGIDRIVIFDQIKPRHFVNVYLDFNIKIIDKIELLLIVFGLHAGSIEAKLQIELASLSHEVPLLREWISRVRKGERAGPFGSGRYEVEAYLRYHNRRIAKIKMELEKIQERANIRHGQLLVKDIPQFILVGYTNTGKTSLFNCMTNLNRPVDDRLFTTISPKRFGINIKGKKIILVDSVGFITGIPPQIIEAFRLTLSESLFSSGIILTLDGSLSEEELSRQAHQSIEILREIGVSGKPLIGVLNKKDIATNLDEKKAILEEILNKNYGNVLGLIDTSALNCSGVDRLSELISQAISLSKRSMSSDSDIDQKETKELLPM